MKGDLAVETILYAIILVLALAILVFFIMKLVPAFGDFVDAALKGLKEDLCKMLPICTATTTTTPQ